MNVRDKRLAAQPKGKSDPTQRAISVQLKATATFKATQSVILFDVFHSCSSRGVFKTRRLLD